MPNDADPASDKAGSGSAPDSAQLDKLISDKVRDAVHARISRTEEKLAGIVAAEIAKFAPAKPAEEKKPEASTDADGKPTLKALQEQIAALNKGIEAERKARADAEKNALETRKAAEVRAHFARHLQGDNAKHLDPYLKFYGEQFQVKDGEVVRKVTGEYGDEQFVPVGKAVDDMFAGDLKFLVEKSKAPQMPRVGGGRGQQISATQPQAQQGTPFFMQSVFEEIGKDRPELAAALSQQAAPNGTNK